MRERISVAYANGTSGRQDITTDRSYYAPIPIRLEREVLRVLPVES